MVSLFVSLSLSGCRTPRTDQTLLRTWTLASIERADGTVVTPDKPYAVMFTQENAGQSLGNKDMQEALLLGYRDGCNDCGGGYTVGTAGALSIRTDLCTLKACIPPAKLEQLFVGALGNATSYEVRGNTLRIVALDRESGARPVLNFVAQ
jgi:hypothetical protein